MSNPPDRPWTEEEKNALLTEILKRDGVASSQLFRLIRENNVTPKWTEIPLPPGRSLSACQMAFNHMHQAHAADQRPLQPFIPDSSSSAHLSYPVQPQTRKRAIQPLGEPLHRSTPSTPRAIQPRPPTSGGAPFNSSNSVDGSTHTAQISPDLDTSMAEPPRKRGRPSKLETERRRAVAQARGEEYPPPKRKTGPKSKNRQVASSPINTMGESGGDSRRDQFSATTGRLQNAIEMDAPPRPHTLHEEPHSSSNRRRREHTDRPMDHQPAEGQNQHQDHSAGPSPHTRLGGSLFPPPDQSMRGGARVMGQDESESGSGGGSGPLSTPRTILASQMSSQPAQPSYAPSFRGINEMAAPNTSSTQGMGSGSPRRVGQSPTVTMAGESSSGGSGGGQKFQMMPGQGGGGGSSGGGKIS